MKTLLSLLIGKSANTAIKTLNLGSGSTWPGHISLSIHKTFIKDLLQKNDLKVVLIAGTNGKTTTSKLLRHILENNGLRVFQNEEGANLVNGIGTSILRHTKATGKIPYDVAIFEVDENNLPHALEQITPKAIVFLNLFRDQLDRYGEVHTIASKWKTALKKVSASCKIILNADDPEIRYLLKEISGKSFYFSIPSKYFTKKSPTQDSDSTHCPECGNELSFSKVAFSHLGKYKCPTCGFTNQNIHENVQETPDVLSGTYNIYNISGAIKTAREVFAIPQDAIHASLKSFTPAFGRQEKIQYKKKDMYVLLSKNPAGFNQSLSVALENKNPVVLLALNDRIPDGRDVSWIWDIEVDALMQSAKHIVVTGDRAYDMALRLKYSYESEFPISNSPFSNKIHIELDSKKAIDEFVEHIPENEVGYILPTYSAMLEIRKILTGKEIL